MSPFLNKSRDKKHEFANLNSIFSQLPSVSSTSISKVFPNRASSFFPLYKVRVLPSLERNSRRAHQIQLVIVQRFFFLHGNAKNEIFMTA